MRALRLADGGIRRRGGGSIATTTYRLINQARSDRAIARWVTTCIDSRKVNRMWDTRGWFAGRHLVLIIQYFAYFCQTFSCPFSYMSNNELV